MNEQLKEIAERGSRGRLRPKKGTGTLNLMSISMFLIKAFWGKSYRSEELMAPNSLTMGGALSLGGSDRRRPKDPLPSHL